MTKSNWIILALIAFIVFLLFRYGCKRDDTADIVSLSKAANDTLRHEADGSVSKQSFAAADVEMITEALERKNKELAEMTKRKAKVGIVTRVQVQIDTVVLNDTVYADSSSLRHATVKTKDYTANISSWPDSTRMRLTAVDTVSYELDKDYRLRAKHSWKDLQVVEMESFYVKPKPTRKSGWKFWAGLGLGIAGGVYLVR